MLLNKSFPAPQDLFMAANKSGRVDYLSTHVD